MPIIEHSKVMPFTVEQMFDVVADVSSYPLFLPWCLAARVWDIKKDGFKAELVVGFGMVRERYTSKVKLADDKKHLQVSLINGPFRHLETDWHFMTTDCGTTVNVCIDFAFSSTLLSRLMGPLFNKSQQRMIAAFESRAYELHEPLSG